MRKMFLIILLGGLIFPSVSLAGTYMACEDTNHNGKCDEGESYVNLYYDGLVPCGRRVCKFNPTASSTCAGATLQGAKYLECRIIKEEQSLESACVGPVGIGMVGKTFAGTRGQPIEIGLPCTFCHLFVMFDGIIDFVLFGLVPPLAILMLVIGGAMYMMAHFGGAEMLPGGARGGPAMLGQAKKLMTSVVVGLIIIYGGWLVINLFLQLIKVEVWTGLQSGWFSINCPIALP